VCSGHGTADDVNGCICDIFFSGDDCEIECSGNGDILNNACVCQSQIYSDAICATVCNGNGQLVDGHCTCNTGFVGLTCAFDADHDPRCGEQGKVINGKCRCNRVYTGANCELVLEADADCHIGQQVAVPVA
jgi:hypothetical protein